VSTSERLTFNDRMRLRIAKEFNRHRRCPECGVKGYGTAAPRWADDPVAKMLGVAHLGCPCCGKGATS
jgi:hypothetical protein